METPVKNNFKDGLTVFEYFVSTHGARKGQADTALKTANSGYLTRRLVDVAQDVVVTMHDCHTLGYVTIDALKDSGDVVYPLASRVFGRVLAADVKDAFTGEVLFKQGHLIARRDVEKLEEAAVDSIKVRSVLTCQAKRGIVRIAYGYVFYRGMELLMWNSCWCYCCKSSVNLVQQLTMKTLFRGTASGALPPPAN
jgi:DNA-directed RNA polymerase subunit beta'